MKCPICSAEIPTKKRSCPNCGRVITASDIKKAQEREDKNQKNNTKDNSSAYRPASSNGKKTQETGNINDIFSRDPNTPKYKDPHSYDRATADVLEYDRMFVNTEQGGTTNDTYERNQARNKSDIPDENEAQYYSGQQYTEDEVYSDDGIYDDYQEDDDESNVIRNPKYSRPKLKFNGKLFIIVICIIIGLAIITVGAIRIGSKLKEMKNNDPNNSSSQNTDAEPETSTQTATVEPVQTTSPLGTYTVKSKTGDKYIYMYKNADNDCLIATIPNDAVIQVDEITDKMAKTTYNIYTGWVYLEDISYSPDAKPDDIPTTAAQTTTAPDDTDSPDAGEYTVTLSSDSSPLNVRDMPSLDGTKIATLSNGETVTVTEIQDGWGKISIDGTDGWVSMAYLK